MCCALHPLQLLDGVFQSLDLPVCSVHEHSQLAILCKWVGGWGRSQEGVSAWCCEAGAQT